MKYIQRLIIIVAFIALSFRFPCPAKESGTSGAAAEIYIKGFKESFLSQSPSRQKAIAADIMELGRKFEAIIDSAEFYIGQRDRRVATLRNRTAGSPAEKHALNRALIDEYIHFSFDSAFAAGKRNLDSALNLEDANMIAESRIDLARVFIQGGYFREAAQQLESIDHEAIDPKIRAEALLAQFFMEFENGFFFAWNRQDHDVSEERMKALYPQIIGLLPDDAYETYQIKTKMAFYKHQYVDATGYCDILLLKNSDPGNWDYINALGDMGFNKLGAHNYVAAMDYMVKSATLALRKGALNIPALRKIAELTYIAGNTELASRLINLSMDYAMAYNSKYRIIESAKGYPMINRQLQEQIEHKNNTISVAAIIMAAMVIMLAASLWYSRKQHKKVKQQADMISRFNQTLMERNQEIESTNHKLSEIHAVTGFLTSKMMNGTSICRELVGKLHKDVSLKIKVRQYDNLPDLIDTFQKEMKLHQVDIDEILLAFFPNFVEQFNQLLREDSRFRCDNGVLPTEVRIFALWRIGLKKNESIARCMDYSLNTIKSYKTRVINSSLYEKDEFYDRLMQIKVNVKV
ncbi:MAG: DUF6377 domain-containing protein [Bacteroides sp.]|nr:DUF6377 domain-containing protein [Bacteroides sp.]MCM1457905.1 DUF6377 domain-containing protein [Lachnoclostridium sp.]